MKTNIEQYQFVSLLNETPVKPIKTTPAKKTKPAKVCYHASGLVSDAERYYMTLFLNHVTQSARS